MHDPNTVAFEIRRPWPMKRRGEGRQRRDKKLHSRRFWFDGYLPPIVTIWHLDPEVGGDEDSCGWFGPSLTKDQLARLRAIAQDEARQPWFQKHKGEAISDPVAATVLLDGALYHVATVLRLSVSLEDMTHLRNRLLHNGLDNLRSSLAYKTGYHGNSDDDAYWREEHAMDLFASLARNILRAKRPWYKHPKWHIHHWRIQARAIQAFKRRLFSRCEICGGRFAWGYSPASRLWGGGGPRWFRGEPGVSHLDCLDRKDVRQ